MNDLSRTRQSLLLRLSQGSNEAWTEFLAVYEQAIYRYLRAKGLQDADALDATQDVIAAVFQRIDSWDNDPTKGSLRAWLFRVARNIAVDLLTSQHRQSMGSGDTDILALLHDHPQADDTETAVFQLEYRRALFQWAAERVRTEVRPSTWQSFWLCVVEGQYPEHVATELNLSVGAVYTAKCRVTARLRDRIAEVDKSCLGVIADRTIPANLFSDSRPIPNRLPNPKYHSPN